MTDVAIRVENLGKLYQIGEREAYKALRDTLTDALATPFRGLASLFNGRRSSVVGHPNDSIWALKDVSFEIKRGEVVGIIGRNGAGKSTLLKILSRITEPTEGYAAIHGRVGSLLEVGTGFHPELTGRENIYLNGAILGMRKAEIERKFDQIVAFAEIAKFIDTPVKRYSSGMYVRLAFAVAAHLEPEILLVDEVLAVGDAAFQKKCLGKMGDVAKEGRTVLFVSHNMAAVSTLCTSAFLLDEGSKLFDGPTMETIRQYFESVQSTSSEWIAPVSSERERISLRAVRVKDTSGRVRVDFTNQEPIVIEIDVDIKEWIPYLKVGFDLDVGWGAKVFTTFHNDVHDLINQEDFQEGTYQFQAVIPHRLLNSNVYYVSPCAGIHRREWIFRGEKVVQFTVEFQIDNPTFQVRKRLGVVSPIMDWKVNYLGPEHGRPEKKGDLCGSFVVE